MDIKANGIETLLTSSARGQGQGFPLLKGAAVKGRVEGAGGQDLSSYRRTALPRRVSSGAGGLPVAQKGGGVRGVEKGISKFSEALFRSKTAGGVSGVGEGGLLRGVGGGEGGIGAGQRAAALRRTGGILSERFLGSNPLLSPAPAPLPSLESMSVGGGVVGLPNGEVGGGGLSADLLRALQKYRVAAEVQG